MNTRLLAFLLTPFASLLLPAVALAAFAGGVNSNGGWFLSFGSGGGLGCAGTLCGIASSALYLINFVLVPLIFAIAFLVFIWGVFNAYIWKRGEEEVKNGHQLILWGLVGFVVMISLWGLVNVVANSFGLAGFAAPPTPTYTPTTY